MKTVVASWGRKELDMTEWLNWTELMVACAVHQLLLVISSFIKMSATYSSFYVLKKYIIILTSS